MSASFKPIAERRLDVTDSEFDAHFALASDHVRLPFPDVKPLNNIDEYLNAIRSKKQGKTLQAEDNRHGRQGRTALAPTTIGKKETNLLTAHGHLSNVLSYMNKPDLKGPLSVLARCLREKTKIKVWTRSAAKLRGACTGFLLAFDRHWNLAMSDVDEVYVLPKVVKMPVLNVTEDHSDPPIIPLPHSDNTCNDQSRVRRRHMNQVFVRGDNVAFVSISDL